MNRLKKEDKSLVVLKYFLHVIKEHSLYDLFDKSFNRVKNSKNSDVNPFGNFTNVYELADKLKEFSARHHIGKRDDDKYQDITNMINHLLHFFLEKGGINPKNLGKYGQEIFDLSCTKIYGDFFTKDMEEISNKFGIPTPRTDRESWLIDMFMRKKNNGEFKGNYIEFIRYVEQVTGLSYNEFIELNDAQKNNQTVYDRNKSGFLKNCNDNDEFEEEEYEDEDDSYSQQSYFNDEERTTNW